MEVMVVVMVRAVVLAGYLLGIAAGAATNKK